MKRILQIGMLSLTLIGAGGAQASPIALSDLFNGGTITAGDKLFDQWEVIGYSSGDGRQLNAANIDVTALNDGGLDPGPGLSFTVINNEFKVNGNGTLNFVDFMFGFRVTAPPGFHIKDNSLELTRGSLNSAVDRSNDLGLRIREEPGSLETRFSVLNDVQTASLFDSSQFAPQQEIFVTKQIYVWSADTNDSANLTGFTQRFSQQVAVVPEPGTLALLALALVGMGAARRRGNAG